MKEKFVWTPGVKRDDCLCTECHSDVCSTRPIKAMAMYGHGPQSWRCRQFGHVPDPFFSGARVPCRRKCGYVRIVAPPLVVVPAVRLVSGGPPYRDALATAAPRLGRLRRLLCRLGIHRWRSYAGRATGFMGRTVWFEACACRHRTRRVELAPSYAHYGTDDYAWTANPWDDIEARLDRDDALS